MATEYKLSYTAEEINNKLGEIDQLSEEILDLNEEIANISAVAYGVCSTAADTADKTVTVADDNFELKEGVTIRVKFTNANSITSPTLNVNGTGAKPMYRYGTTALSTGTTTTGWVAGSIMTLTYDGTGWIREYWNNTTYSNVALGQGYATCSTAEATTAKVGTLSSYALTTGGIVSVKFTYAVPASATLNINSKGAKAIYYRGAKITDGVIKAGDVATFIYNGSYYHLLSIDRWQNDIDGLAEEIDGKLDKNQGSANTGKMLVVGSDGNVTLDNMPDYELTEEDKTEIIDAIAGGLESGGEVSPNDVEQGDSVTLTFPAQENNRVYYGGKNLFDGVIRNIALGGSGMGKVLSGSNYRGFYCPVQPGKIYTVSRSKSLGTSSERFGFNYTAVEPANGVDCVAYLNSQGSNALKFRTNATPENAKYIVVYLSNGADDFSDVQFQVEEGSALTEYEPYCGNYITTNEDSVTVTAGEKFTTLWCDSCESSQIRITKNMNFNTIISQKVKSELDEVNAKIDELSKFKPFNSDTGNVSIVCAKEHTYNDGTAPKVEYYLLEEWGTNKFYISNDLKSKRYAFTFKGDSANYAFGITKDNDIIACAIADSLPSGKDDSHRVNPYCWLARENWSTQYEVEFDTNIKPCGWLSNCGFRSLPNGDVMFCEYTRMTVATSNVWKISGTPTDSSNWEVVKQFQITTEDNNTGFKHIHTVQYDHYSGVVYFSTGDDDQNAMIFYSTDDGVNWTQLGTPSQKYCRNLNFTFTKDYVYWAPDFSVQSKCYLFRATRDSNGVISFSSIEDYVFIGDFTNKGASYGTAYLEELNAILVLDRCDGEVEYMPLLIVDLNNGTVKQLASLESPSGAQLVGFRTRYSEWYPKNGTFICGFGFHTVGYFNCVNHIKGFGNMGYSNTGQGELNINNLVLYIQRNGNDFSMKMDTLYI